jgi:RimJ/RimL family protein N-acetyltransferase
MNARPKPDAASIAESLDRLKRGDAGAGDFPGVLVWQNRIIGRMKTLTYADANDENLLASLAAWRNNNVSSFFTQFEATVASTSKWLSDIILATPNRIIFLIADESGRLAGWCGTSSVSPDGAELDGVIRGERGGHAMLMILAERAMLDWLFKELGVDRVYARIFSDNISSVRLFLSLGLKIVRQQDFQKVVEGNFVRYEPILGSASGPVRKLAYLEMPAPG